MTNTPIAATLTTINTGDGTDAVTVTGAQSPLAVNGGAGDDTLNLDFTAGNIIPAGSPGISYDGGAGLNTLNLTETGSSYTAINEVYSASGPGGEISVDGQLVDFTNLAPINDTLPATNFTFIGPAAAVNINVQAGPTVGSTATTEVASGDATSAFELIDFANKTNVTIDGGDGDNVINVTPNSLPTGTNLAIDGGAGNNTVVISGTAASDAFNVSLSGTDTVVQGASSSLLLTSIQAIQLNGWGATIQPRSTSPTGTRYRRVSAAAQASLSMAGPVPTA